MVVADELMETVEDLIGEVLRPQRRDHLLADAIEHAREPLFVAPLEVLLEHRGQPSQPPSLADRERAVGARRPQHAVKATVHLHPLEQNVGRQR